MIRLELGIGRDIGRIISGDPAKLPRPELERPDLNSVQSVQIAFEREHLRRPSKAESAPQQPRRPDEAQRQKSANKPEIKRIPWWEFFDHILRVSNSESKVTKQPVPPKPQS
jgi:hypothetical protein